MILPGSQASAVQQAAQCIQAGGLVGFPTETVYGLGADASNDAAVAGIFSAKGRPSNHPLIVHVASAEQVADYASSVPAFAQQLMQAFWPGPLTVILPRRSGVASAAAGGQASIGLRCPSHPVALAFLTACGTGVAGPSANRFGRVSPTTAAHVQGEFGDALLVLDGGPCDVGIESSIVDCTRSQPVLLRPGVLTRAQLQAACGVPVLAADETPNSDAAEQAAPRAPGTLQAHYAPNAKVRLMDGSAIQTALGVLGPQAAQAAHIAVYARTQLHAPCALLRRMPDDARATAQQLFAVLREFDAQGARLIWIENPPDTADWDGVRDRLTRAAAS